MADHRDGGAGLPQRDANGWRLSTPGRTGRTARSFAAARAAGDDAGMVQWREASETHRVDEASGTRHAP